MMAGRDQGHQRHVRCERRPQRTSKRFVTFSNSPNVAAIPESCAQQDEEDFEKDGERGSPQTGRHTLREDETWKIPPRTQVQKNPAPAPRHESVVTKNSLSINCVAMATRCARKMEGRLKVS